MPTGIRAFAILALAFYATSAHSRACSMEAPQEAGTATTSCSTNLPCAVAAAPTPAPASAEPLASPAMAGPLHMQPPISVPALPSWKLDVNGVLSGFGAWQSHSIQSDRAGRADISNGQIFLQKASGTVQFYVQAGAYSFPSLGAPILSTEDTIADFYGPLPTAYLKLAPTSSVNLMVGKLPTLYGAESTFSIQNMNIERGLLWNQENAVVRGVQLNYSGKKLSGSLAWNDGFYSNRWNWLTGLLTYAFSGADSLVLVAGGNTGHTGYSTTATPAYQNNSSIYNVIYTHTTKRWVVQPYFQYTHVPTYSGIGVQRATSTQGEAILGSYALSRHLFLTGRLEYTSSTGSASDGSVNLLYGPGSHAGSVTFTPTYRNKGFFARAEISYVRAGNFTPGDAFGVGNTDSSQTRGLIETGFLF